MSSIRCPRCGAEAHNNYGHTRNGKQRFICLVCNRQFVEDGPEERASQRPRCPQCGAKMHVYMHDVRAIRYRCADYPKCCGYAKINQET